MKIVYLKEKFIVVDKYLSELIIEPMSRYIELYKLYNYYLIKTKNPDYFEKYADMLIESDVDAIFSDGLIKIEKIVGIRCISDSTKILIDSQFNISKHLKIFEILFDLLFKHLNVKCYYNQILKSDFNRILLEMNNIDIYNFLPDNDKKLFSRLKFSNYKYIKYLLKRYHIETIKQN